MENIPTKLKYRTIILKTAPDVVRFSFIVRRSISYLDLSFYQYPISNYLKTSCYCCGVKRLNSFINTEEKCRKFFTASRNLLYTLHLDLPKGRECNLKDVPYCIPYDYEDRLGLIPHIGRVNLTCRFEISILNDLLEEAINVNTEKLKILAWILKINISKLPLIYLLEIQTVNKFIDCFYPEITDSDIFEDFINHFDFSEWICTYERPEILEYLLYYALRYRNICLNEIFPFEDVIDRCIFNHCFSNISPILKYMNIPIISEEDYLQYRVKISSFRPNLTRKVLYKAEKWIKQDRIHQMLQFIWMYIDCDQHCTAAASEALRLIWCSIPDICISFQETKRVFRGVFSSRELKNMYDFYATAVGKFYENIEPRSLQHLCRFTIRKTLSENQIWIPEGLKRLGLPKSFQLFLNLKKVFIATNESGQ